jgi:hypothetical protein
MRESLAGFIIGIVRRFVWTMLAVAVLAACNGGDASPTSSTSTISFPSPVSPTATEPPTPSPLPSPVVAVEHGGEYFAVYLGIGSAGSAEVQRAESRFADLGIEAFAGDLSCDEGAAESLGVEPGTFGVGAYFEREADATAFADALDAEGGVVYGPIPVRTLCAD